MSFTDRLPLPFRERPPVVPVMRLSGVIGVAGFGSGMTLSTTERAIEALFKVKRSVAVGLAINSPGGSAVQSSLIATRIRKLAEEKKKPVIAFVEDVAASGGYWLAAVADEIVVDASSIVGSIGVISAGFGFPEAIARLGIERRVHTAGKRKSLLDPFRPEKAEDVAILKDLQGRIHENFIAWVRARRGDRLRPEAAGGELFDGRVFLGEEAIACGLADKLGDSRSFLRERFGDKVKIVPVGPRRSWLQRRLRPGGRAGLVDGALAADVLRGAFAALEERAHWQRYGL